MSLMGGLLCSHGQPEYPLFKKLTLHKSLLYAIAYTLNIEKNFMYMANVTYSRTEDTLLYKTFLKHNYDTTRMI